ncbi:2-amino-3-ketobutyrate coenzyme A ligase [Luteococcus japonicus LSP_Lj1]|uniref:2-amino-3-ketobutyrate coenzyme A ligase n=1 Tax=Luteococcus japonicus LSP_Lj1 TaxID=1255658 RepID=A0A1R4I6P3_9ACTN|nr:2-amino-3-ketobutyrate coenzyme A ligase [Luteococcus japonicus LSP_Lj1]
MYTKIKDTLLAELAELKEQGLYKVEVPLSSAQSAHIDVEGKRVVNLCANNYLGLADDPRLVEAAKKALDEWGFGMASVRFICGTQDLHKTLESKITSFLHPVVQDEGGRPPFEPPALAGSQVQDEGGQWDTILYSSCFDANGGLFEVLCGPDDAIISDELNHASIIDGVRLSKAKRLRYRNRDMADLEARLIEAKDCRYRLIATDGVFSMDGYLAPLDEICDLAEKYDALVMVDDSHAVGFVGQNGAGTPERYGVQDRVDIITGTLGKALGGASGGYTCARAEIVEMLRQKSRPYLFSNSLAPSIAGAALATIELLEQSGDLREKLHANTAWFRAEMGRQGFEIPESDHAIVPVMIGDAVKAAKMADIILAEGIYVRAFSYPVVPQGKARIRTQMSATLTQSDLEAAVAAFAKACEQVG